MDSLPSIVLYGAGGQGKVVADCIERAGTFSIVGFVDDATSGEFFEYPILGDASALPSIYTNGIRHAFACIGDPTARQSAVERLHSAGFMIATILHPSAQCGRGSSFGEGAVVLPAAVIGPDAIAGIGCIINTSATVDHDCVLGSYVHIAPGAHLAGGVHVGDHSFIGIGSVVREGISIGRNVIVGAGSVVVENLPDDCVAFGVPAKPQST